MKKFTTLLMAECCLKKILQKKMINIEDYISSIEEIQEKLQISEEEYVNFINENWLNHE